MQGLSRTRSHHLPTSVSTVGLYNNTRSRKTSMEGGDRAQAKHQRERERDSSRNVGHNRGTQNDSRFGGYPFDSHSKSHYVGGRARGMYFSILYFNVN